MFEIDKQVAIWRRERADAGLDADVIEELESHLVASFQDCRRCGEREEVAWRRALEELGDSSELQREFAKVATIPIWDKLILGSVFLLFTLITAAAVISALHWLKPPWSHWSLAINALCISVGYLTALACGLTGAYAHFRRALTRRAEARLHRFLRIPLTLGLVIALISLGTGIGSGMIWSSMSWGTALNGNPRELASLVIFAGLFALVLFSLLRRIRCELLLTISTIGGIVISATWSALFLLPGSQSAPAFAIGATLFVVQGLGLAIGTCFRRQGSEPITG